MFTKTSGLFNIFVVGFGSISGTIISAIALILFSRFMGPAEFGVFSAAFAAMQIIVRLADLGVNTAAERTISRSFHTSPQRADRLMRIALYIKLVLFVVITVAAWIAAPYISVTLLHFSDPTLLRMVVLVSAGTIFYEYTNLIFQATQRFGKVAQVTIAQATGKLVFGIILISQGLLTATTGVILYGLMPLFGALVVWKPFPLKSLRLPANPKSDLLAILNVAKWTGIATLAATLADNIDTLMVQSFLDSFQTGLWSAAARIAAFVSIVGWSIGTVLSNRVTKYKQLNHLNNYLSKAWKIALLSFFGLSLSLLLAGPAIYFTVGSSYLSSTTILQLLIISSALSAATAPFAALFYLFDRPQYYAMVGILQTIVLLVGDYFAIPIFGLAGAAVVRIITKLAVLLFTLIYARQSYLDFKQNALHLS